MAGRAVWTGYISFGDLNLPVKLHTAIREERIQFHLLHKGDLVRLRQQMVCAYENLPVLPEDQARGFQVEEGKYIILDPDEIEQTAPESSRVIEVHEFVENRQIDPLFLERVYYLEPDVHLKEYNALSAALIETDAAGVCTWTMRKRSWLGALQAGGKTLRLTTLRYADEVIPARSLELREIPLSEKELRIGSDLIEHLTARFQPQKFENEHQKKLQALIARKTRGEEIALVRPKRLRPTAPDRLLQALEAGLKKVA